ncbi:class I SAM-dependent methyltransferase [Desulfovibrio sp. JC010]|uniref:class I SAM-dependent methyltransferase n=1 Tax=Desulfovibrio sp. JC010 TaxID=2593641 RepID=UPI0013D856F9|nr:class I SAM-dependent methyltransferase [Desulfovibrio sp. JC010]NDV25603.1 class I SAM-dependent methyltransferase [Desulfovibrio sp. JC010]
MTDQKTNQTIAAYWDRMPSNQPVSRLRWWESERIIRHVNKIICGKELPGFNQGAIVLLNKMTGNKKFRKGLSIGCGAGTKELNLMKQGIVESFDLYDLSKERTSIAADSFRQNGFGDRVNIYNQEFRAEDSPLYDFIHWDNSLHHMFDCDKAICETYNLLEPGGVFFMNDFIGKSRFQWSDEELELINTFRNSFSDEYFHLADGRKVSRHVARPSKKVMIATDPSEAADSESIIPSLKKRLKNPTIIFTGGVIYHSGLNDILSNIDEHSQFLTTALHIDSLASQAGLNQYAVCIAIK